MRGQTDQITEGYCCVLQESSCLNIIRILEKFKDYMGRSVIEGYGLIVNGD